MTTDDLTTRDCAPCRGDGPTILDPAAHLARLHPDWRADGARIVRRFEFKTFAKATQMANLAAWLGERMGHHPDIAFGWAWCEVAFTSHELGGLSENDFTCAARLDQIVA